MRMYFIIAGCLGLVMWSLAAQGQNFVWAKQFGGGSANWGESVAVDAAGNVYATGFFTNTVDFDPGPGTFNLSSSGSYDVFITKLDAHGNLIWAKQFSGTGGDYGKSIAVDAAGNVFVAGYFSDTADFNPGPATFNLSTSSTPDVFIAKLDVSGNLVFARQLGSATGTDRGYSIAVDATGNVYASGFFEDIADFDPGPGTYNLTSVGNVDVHIIKIDASGNLVWAKQFGGPFYDYGYSVAVDVIGNVYATGYFQSTADFDPGPGIFNLISPGGNEVFIVKLDTSGNLIWAKEFGGAYQGEGLSITVNAFGNIITTGYFSGTADFDPGPGTFNLTSSGGSDIFITNLDTSGNLIWAKKFGDASDDMGYSTAVDTIGNVYAAGYFSDTADFDPGTGTFNLTSSGSKDIFIIKLDASGNLAWAKSFGGITEDIGYSIAVDASGKVYATGRFSNTVDFDPGSGTHNLTAAFGFHVFVLKLAQTPPSVAQGRIFWDTNLNCNIDTPDISFPVSLIKAEPGPFYSVSDSTGRYIINLLDTGSYTISLATQDTLWQPSCSTSYNIQVTSIPDTTTGIDFAMRASSYCPRLTVELGTSILRRCFNNTYTIRYANTGTLPASAYMEVDFGDNLLPQSSTLPWSTVSGNVYKFQLGNININQSGLFNVSTLLDCNASLGSTQCVTAHIYPDSVCLPTSTGWDKSETKVTGTCVNDSLVCFKVKNRSSPPSGNMQGTAPWRLYINDTLMTQGTYQLAGQDSLIQCYPANGKTYRLEADQRLGHPGNSHPQAIVEACGNGPVDFGFVNTVVQDDEDLFVETFCMTVVGSYDPNDKQVFPTGITANKYIKPEDELEYLIRFQNTGNDTAFKVVIRDTIQTDVIDIATLTSGASSHDYTFNIYGHGIAEWTFDNILLPDSNVNEEASHGFVKFKAKLLPNISPGTIVANSADIYFDFNTPVITNEVWNTVFDTVLRAPVIISGTVLTESNTPVPGVTVKLAGSATDSIVTAADGRYDFEVEPGGSYTITPLKNNDAIPSKGLTTYDILTMRRHLLGMGALPSPYKIISAAEVNAAADTSVTTQDIVLIRSLILGNTTSFPGSRLWQFVSSDYIFSDSSHPFPFGKTRTYTNIISPQTNQNFIGIKLGDVNGSWEE